MDLLDLSAMTLAAAAVAGVANHLWFKLPHTIGLVVFSLVASACVAVIDRLAPGARLGDTVSTVLSTIDFRALVMDGLLGFLLFAGAMHVDLAELAKRKWPIAVMASVGVLISTVAVGGMVWLGWNAIGIEVPLVVCLAFGALISPTDPVAVISILKTIRVPHSLEAKVAGESLFNDGVAVVVFAAILAAAAHQMGGAGEAPSAASVAILFLRDAVGGALFGAAMGWGAYRLMRRVDEHSIEIMVTLALVAVTVALSRALHVSAPIAVVVAGLIMGSVGTLRGMSEHTRQHLGSFWGVLDESLNSVLFILLGILAVGISFDPRHALAAVLAIPVVVFARYIAVTLSLASLGLVRQRFVRYANVVLTWGGLRGAVSLALAVSLPEGPHKNLLVTVTYLVVIFSVVVQGLTVKQVIAMTIGREEAREAALEADAEEAAAASEAEGEAMDVAKAAAATDGMRASSAA